MPNINLEITDQRREDMIVGALEGGSNYWYFLSESSMKAIYTSKLNKEEPISIKMWDAILNGATIPVYDIEDIDGDKLGEINLKSIKKGEELMAKNHELDFMCIINEEDDASTADLWFQYCVLGEIVYG